MKIAVIVPTRGDERKQFVDFCKYQISIQTRQPDKILMVDFPPIGTFPDITKRYKIGFEQLQSQGFDVMIVFEDDDYYSPDYIETIIDDWQRCGMPELFGTEFTTYYHLLNNKTTHIHHAKRASMCCTLMRLDITKPIAWGESNYAFTDLVLWNQLNGKTNAKKNKHIGIKHGVGLCGGSGHKLEFQKQFSTVDANNMWLKKHTTPIAFEFYMNIKNQLHESNHHENKNK